MDQNTRTGTRRCRWKQPDRCGIALHSNGWLSTYSLWGLWLAQRNPKKHIHSMKTMQFNKTVSIVGVVIKLTMILFCSKLIPVRLTIWWTVKIRKSRINISAFSFIKASTHSKCKVTGHIGDTYNLNGLINSFGTVSMIEPIAWNHFSALVLFSYFKKRGFHLRCVCVCINSHMSFIAFQIKNKQN